MLAETQNGNESQPLAGQFGPKLGKMRLAVDNLKLINYRLGQI
jgi:hypothetical protein